MPVSDEVDARRLARARATSTLLMRACGNGDRSSFACSIRGSITSSANFVCPVTLARASTRRATCRDARVIIPYFSRGPHPHSLMLTATLGGALRVGIAAGASYFLVGPYLVHSRRGPHPRSGCAALARLTKLRAVTR